MEKPKYIKPQVASLDEVGSVLGATCSVFGITPTSTGTCNTTGASTGGECVTNGVAAAIGTGSGNCVSNGETNFANCSVTGQTATVACLNGSNAAYGYK